MLSSYFKIKTKRSDFIERIQSIIENYKDKKVLIYGAGAGFVELNKEHKFTEKLNIVGIADKKFEEQKPSDFEGITALTPAQIADTEYDIILISIERSTVIEAFLKNSLNIPNEKLEVIFKEDIKDEQSNYIYLENYNFRKNLEKLKKKLKNKTVVIYGAGVFFELIKKYYNLEGINIIGICDQRFEKHEPDEQVFGYKAYSINELADLKPDYILVATKFYISIVENLFYEVLKDTKIKIKPLVKKPFMVLFREIWG